MGVRTRLESAFGELARAFDQAGRPTRRRVVCEACILAASRTGLHDHGADAAIEALRRHVTSGASLHQDMEHLSAELDNRYLHLAEKSTGGVGPEALLLFRQARAAAALAFALSDDLSDSLYEAIIALGDLAEVTQLLPETLGVE